MAYRPKVTLSKSSIGMYEECARKWAMHYHMYRTPLEIRREVIFQKELMGYFALVGQIADDVITYALRNYVSKGAFPKNLRGGAEKLLKQYLDQTDDWTYAHESGTNEPKRGRRQPVDRYYYNGLPAADEREQIVEMVMGFVDTWFASPIPELLLSYGIEAWEVPLVDHMPSFEHEKIVIWSKYDFVIRTANETLIFDWKTGKVSEQTENDIQDQLHTYAEFAIQEWGVDPSTIRLYGVWLVAGPESCVVEYPYQALRIDNLKREWVAKHEKLVHLLQSAGTNYEHLFDVFPMTQQVHRCKGCKFRVCEGYQRVSL